MPRKRIQAGILYGEMKFGLNLVNLSCAKARAHQAIMKLLNIFYRQLQDPRL